MRSLNSRPCSSARAAAAGAMLLILLGLPNLCLAWEIGHRTVVWTDPARGNRQIETQVYYPADTPGDNVPVGGGGAVQFPVVVFGHGYLITWSDYENIWTSVVPEGYIVALPDTEGNLFPDHGEFGLDLAFLADTIRDEGTDPGSPFFGAVASTAAVMGHSMGGGASILAASGHPTITGVANLAAAETNPSAIQAAASVTATALLFAGSLDCVTPPEDHQIPIYQSLGSDCRTLITLTGASHCQFAEDNFFCNFGESGCPDPTLSRAEQQALTDEFLLPWLAGVLKDDPDGWALFQDRLTTSTQITYQQDCPTTGVEIAAWDERSLSLTLCPNPFRESSTLRFRAPEDGPFRLEIFDASGRLVRRLLDGPGQPGVREILWDGLTSGHRQAPAGVYFVRLDGPSGSGRGTLIRIE